MKMSFFFFTVTAILAVKKGDSISFAFLEPNEFQMTSYGLQQVVDF